MEAAAALVLSSALSAAAATMTATNLTYAAAFASSLLRWPRTVGGGDGDGACRCRRNRGLAALSVAAAADSLRSRPRRSALPALPLSDVEDVVTDSGATSPSKDEGEAWAEEEDGEEEELAYFSPNRVLEQNKIKWHVLLEWEEALSATSPDAGKVPVTNGYSFFDEDLVLVRELHQ